MKILTLNFVTCAVKDCKTSPASFPLHIKDAELELAETDFQPEFLQNILPRLDMEAIKSVANELGLAVPEIPETEPVAAGDDAADVEMGEGEKSALDDAAKQEQWRKLHRLLLETHIEKGILVCGNCQHEYRIMEGIPNFLLPPHLV